MSNSGAQDAGTGHSRIHPPKPFPTLRQIGIDRPVLQEIRPIVKDLPQLTRLDDPLRQHNGRQPAIIVPNRIGDPRPFDRIDHALRLKKIPRQWLFAEDHLTRRGSGDRNLRMRIIRRTDIDGIDICTGN